MLLSGSSFGQQTPSQRFQPVRDGLAPPSVHVTTQQMQKLPPKFRAANTQYQLAPAGTQAANSTARYTFSDQAAQRGTAVRPSWDGRDGDPSRGTRQRYSASAVLSRRKQNRVRRTDHKWYADADLRPPDGIESAVHDRGRRNPGSVAERRKRVLHWWRRPRRLAPSGRLSRLRNPALCPRDG